MKEEWVNPFLTPAKHVWEMELQDELHVAGTDLVSNQFTTDDVTAIIGVSGSLEGNVLYGFADDCASAAVAKMLEEEPTVEITPMSLSALGELANMITGNAATLLAQNGYTCDISPPVIIEPAGSRFTTTAAASISSAPMIGSSAFCSIDHITRCR